MRVRVRVHVSLSVRVRVCVRVHVRVRVSVRKHTHRSNDQLLAFWRAATAFFERPLLQVYIALFHRCRDLSGSFADTRRFIGLFCGYTGLFSEYTGLFCRFTGPYCGDVEGSFAVEQTSHIHRPLLWICRALSQICTALLRRWKGLFCG